MGRTSKLWLLLPRHVRRFPPDLGAVVGLVVLAGLAATLPGARKSAFRVLFGAPFVLFAPGYAILAALFPKSGSVTREDRTSAVFLSEPREGITLFERLLFSVGLSIVVVPLVGFALNFTPWDISFESLWLSIGGFTVAMALLGAVRRWELPPEERFRVPYDEWYGRARSELFESTFRFEEALNVIILASMLIAVAGGAYAVLGPQEGQTFTEFYLLSENETGELVADDYPTTVGEGQNRTLVVGIGNHEGRTTEYSVIVRLRRVETRNGSLGVVDARRLDQFRVEVPANETIHRRHTVTPRATGERLQLQYLLYVGEPPANPTVENAYRNAHVWVNTTGGSQER